MPELPAFVIMSPFKGRNELCLSIYNGDEIGLAGKKTTLCALIRAHGLIMSNYHMTSGLGVI